MSIMQLAVASENIAELSKSYSIVSSEVHQLREEELSSGICDSFAALMQTSRLSMEAAVAELKVRHNVSYY